jgi:hypothetical protein
VQAASDFVFHKAKYAAPGSIFLSDNAAVAPAPLYTRKLEAKDGDHVQSGTTPLIAAMRCYVASKLGYLIELPEEIK